MGRVARWLLEILYEALKPLVVKATGLLQAALDTQAKLDTVSGQLRDVRHGLTDLRDAVALEGQIGLEQIVKAIAEQSRALHDWEAALLDRVSRHLDAVREDIADSRARAALHSHAEALLAGLVTPEELRVVRDAVENVAKDARLAEQRPDLRAKLSIDDALVKLPEVPYRIADLVRAVVYCQMRGDV